jgi:hypothetical protein
MPRTYYYCELCDYMCDTHYFHLTHEGSKDHIRKCINYKSNLIKDDYTLGVFRKVLLDETGVDYKNNTDLCDAVIMYLSNYKITYEQIQKIKNKNKQFEMSLLKDNSNTTIKGE